MTLSSTSMLPRSGLHRAPSRPRRRLSLLLRLVLLVGSLLAAKAASATASPEAPATAPPPEAPSAAVVRACAWLTNDAPELSDATRVLLESPPPPGRVRLTGLASLREADLWSALALPEGARSAVNAEELLVLLSRLWSTGAFSALSLAAGQEQGQLVYEVKLRESALVRSVKLRGLVETPPEELLARLLEAAPAPASTEPVRRRGSRVRRGKSRVDRLDDADGDDEEPASKRSIAERRCAPLTLPQASFAKFERDQVKPGLVYRGLARSLERVLRALHSDGYPLATAEARLTTEGELQVTIDEGRLVSLEVRGLEPRLRGEVERALGLRPGEIFSTAELRRALRRLDDLYPFVRHGKARVAQEPASFAEELLEGGGRLVTPRGEAGKGASEGPAGWSAEPGTPGRKQTEKASERDAVEGVQRRSEAAQRALDADRLVGDWSPFDSDWDDDWDDLDWPRSARPSRALRATRFLRTRTPRAGAQVVGPGRVELWMSTRSTEADWQPWQLFRHTPVTGFAPGLTGTWRLWDPNDRVHLSVDGDLAWNSRRSSWTQGPGAGFFERAGAQERVDWLLGLRAQIPSLRIAELGAQVYALTDTADRWRVAPNDSYLWSALANRPDSDYFRRSGLTAMLTLHPLAGLTLGGEVRLDHVWGMNPPGKVWTLFNGDEPARAPAQVTGGEFGSFLARLEWTTEEVPLHKVGGLWRDPERSLIVGGDRFEGGSGFATMTTLEVGSPALTGGPGGHWSKLVSDNLLVMEFGRAELSLRGRAGFSKDAPLHKQEALGGFGALRGYDFKELRGDSSLLGSVELRDEHWGAFLDVGSVRSGGDWLSPKPGVGLDFFLGRTAKLELAWRLDGAARALPDARLLWGWKL